MRKIIVKVWKRKTSGEHFQKIITVPSDCDIEEGDYIELIKIK